ERWLVVSDASSWWKASWAVFQPRHLRGWLLISVTMSRSSSSLTAARSVFLGRYVHSIKGTAANAHDLEEAHKLLRPDDHVVYGDAGYQGAHKRPEITGDEHLKDVEWKVAARKGVLKTMHPTDRAAQARQAGIRAKVEHPFLIMKRDFGFTKTRYRGIAKNLNFLHVLFASANYLMRARAVALTAPRLAEACPKPPPPAQKHRPRGKIRSKSDRGGLGRH